MDTDEIRLFSDSLRQAVSRRGEAAVDEALAEVDWQAALADDPLSATRAVFTLLGELNLTSSTIDDVLSHALGLVSTDRGIVLPPLGSHHPPAGYERAELTIAGIASGRLTAATQVVVAIDGGKQDFLAMVDVSALDHRAISGIDPLGNWHAISGVVKIGQFQAVDWQAAVVAGQLALAQQLASAARAMLGLARDHAISRSQFDRPIASFQAVRHKLADALVVVEAADAALDAGWADPTPFSATMAKLIAGTTAKTVAKHAQQVLAGMGFTAEHPFHHYLKRTMFLDQLLGSSAHLRAELGQQVIHAREVPPLLPL